MRPDATDTFSDETDTTEETAISPDVGTTEETDTSPDVDTTDETDTTEETDPTPVVESNLTLIFNANGGYFGSNETDNQNSKKLKALEDIESDEVLSISSGKGTPTYSNNTKEFKGWSTEKNPSANSPIVYYYDGKQLVKGEIEALFGSNATVILYAVWVDKTPSTTPTTTTPTNSDETPTITEENIKPHNNRTLWEQMQYLIAKYVYDPDWSVSYNKYVRTSHYEIRSIQSK